MATMFTPTCEAGTSKVIAMRETAMSLISESLRAWVSPSMAGTAIIHHLPSRVTVMLYVFIGGSELLDHLASGLLCDHKNRLIG